MRRTVLPSCTKFWPSFFVGVTARSSARSRISAGPSRRGVASAPSAACRCAFTACPPQPRCTRQLLAPRTGSSCHGPYTLRVFDATCSQSSSRSAPSTSAMNRIVCGTRYGAFGRPRSGTGVRYGASVSTRMRSRGATRSASRRFSAFLNVTLPANERYQPASVATRASSSPPEKQWNTVRSGAPTRRRVSSTSS